MGLVLEAAGVSLQGIRPANQDSMVLFGKAFPPEETVHVAERGLPLRGTYGVFDGMGGLWGGGFASSVAARVFGGLGLPRCVATRSLERWLAWALGVCSVNLREQGKAVQAECGSTAAVLVFCGRRAVVGNVGDSRVYRMRGELSQLSRDHSEQEALQALGLQGIPAGLTQYLGMPEEYRLEPCLRVERLRLGDIYLLCSDGVSGTVGDKTLKQLLGRLDSALNLAEAVCCAAKEAGSRDNITALVCKVLEG